MIEKFNYKTLVLARESRGLTQSELSASIDHPQSSLSKIENGNQAIDQEFLSKISAALSYPQDFFTQSINIYPPNLHYRKKASVSAKTLSLVEARMNIYRENIQVLLNSIEMVTPNHARYLWSQFSSLRIRQKEPIDIPVEKPSLLRDIVNSHLSDLGYSKEELSSTLKLNQDDFEEVYLPKEGLRLVR